MGGQTDAVKVKKKVDNSGLGQVQDSTTGNVGWSETSQSFDAVLAKLNKKYNVNNTASEFNTDKKQKKEKKEKKKRKRDSDSDLSENEKEREMEDEHGNEESDDDNGEPESGSRDKKDRKQRKDKEGRQRQRQIKREEKEKLGVKQYSNSDLTAILGVGAFTSIASKAS